MSQASPHSSPSLTRPTDVGSVRAMFDTIAPTYDLLNTILSLGLHRLWELKIASSTPTLRERGRCLDLCTGTGALLPALSPRFAEVVAADISPKMLEVGRRRHPTLGNVKWVEADAQQLPFPAESFDAITVAYGVRNLPDPVRGMREMYRVSRRGGSLSVLEFGTPNNTLWRSVFSLYSNVVIPTIGGLVSGNAAAYRYLPKTSAAFPCGREFTALMEQAGWAEVSALPLCGGVAYLYRGTRV